MLGARRLVALARAVTANSRRCRADLAALGPRARRARLVRFGAPALPPARAPAWAPRRFALCAARQADHKGQDLLVFAWSLLAARGLRVPLLVCGRDHSRGGLRRFARRLGVDGLLVFPGEVPHRALRGLMARAELVVAPSRVEGFGLSAVEALAAGTPVVAARVGGLPEVVRHGREGLLVAPKDPAALARACGRLLEDGPLRRRLAAGARRRAAGFSWEAAGAEYARLAGVPRGGRMAVAVWQEPRDHTARAILEDALAGLRAAGRAAEGRVTRGRSGLEALAAGSPDGWLVLVLRYRTAGTAARFFAERGLRPVVALC